MKKRVITYRLNRDTKSRSALFKSLVASLVMRERIETTMAKAKAVRPIFEKLLTKAKTGSVAARRQIQSYVQDPIVVKKFVSDIAPRYAEVKGGYTSLTMVGNRRGDDAPVVRLQLTKMKVAAPKAGAKPEEAKKETAAPKVAAPAVAAPKVSKPTAASPKAAAKPTIGIRRGER